jgi:hypothetical protein
MALKHLVAGGILCAATMAALPAAAMPIDNLARGTHANIEQVHWVCGPYRCFWRSNYYYYGPRFYAAPRVYWGPRFRYRYGRRW